jgi:thiamine transporter
MKEKQVELRKLIMSSMFVAMAVVIELILKALPASMPFGGNFIGLFMIPLVFVGFMFGLKYGILAGLVYGIVELILAPAGYIIGWSFLLDYLVGFTAFGLTGLFKGKLNHIPSVISGVLIAGFVRYLSVSFAGVIFWSEIINADAYIYSFITYNLGYNVSTTLITLVFVILLSRSMNDISKKFIYQDSAA